MIPTIQKRNIRLTDRLAITMVYVPGGSFLMGSEDEEAYDWEKPIHEVILSPYWIGETPVTQAQWEAVMGSNPSYFQGADRPVEQVSWHDAREFIQKLSQQTGEAFRLPTEAQWEFAARGGKRSQGFEYAGSNKLKEVGWYRDNSHRETKPVGLKAPNELGLHDMSGNVDEWCQDRYENTKQKHDTRNPEGPDQGEDRVIRGGCWSDDPWFCRVSVRGRRSPEDRASDQGFRLYLPVQ